jgi:hypothetical protein
MTHTAYFSKQAVIATGMRTYQDPVTGDLFILTHIVSDDGERLLGHGRHSPVAEQKRWSDEIAVYIGEQHPIPITLKDHRLTPAGRAYEDWHGQGAASADIRALEAELARVIQPSTPNRRQVQGYRAPART